MMRMTRVRCLIPKYLIYVRILCLAFLPTFWKNIPINLPFFQTLHSILASQTVVDRVENGLLRSEMPPLGLVIHD